MLRKPSQSILGSVVKPSHWLFYVTVVVSVGLHGLLLGLPLPEEQPVVEAETPKEEAVETIKLLPLNRELGEGKANQDKDESKAGKQALQPTKPESKETKQTSKKNNQTPNKTPQPQSTPLRSTPTNPPKPEPAEAKTLESENPEEPNPSNTTPQNQDPNNQATNKGNSGTDPNAPPGNNVDEIIEKFFEYDNAVAGSDGFFPDSDEELASAQHTLDNIDDVMAFYQQKQSSLDGIKVLPDPVIQDRLSNRPQSKFFAYQVDFEDTKTRYLHLLQHENIHGELKTVMFMADQEYSVEALKSFDKIAHRTPEQDRFFDTLNNDIEYISSLHRDEIPTDISLPSGVDVNKLEIHGVLPASDANIIVEGKLDQNGFAFSTQDNEAYFIQESSGLLFNTYLISLNQNEVIVASAI
ncbi:MAG: hypothetical protein F6J87_02110 [Spirulina sp. SIO3F2]|nr:hypothetical protein [Spirulina sp. SIO3F2]